MKRNPTIDILRGIAIFLVVFGHISHIGWTRTYIWGFHIPIFFFISGMLFNENKYNSITNFIKSKFRTLIIPYGIFYLTTFTYWLVIERHTRGGGVTPASQLIGLFYGTYNLKYMMFNGALWFIPCLFSTELLYYFIAKIKNNTKIFITIILIYIIGFLLRKYTYIAPFGIGAAMIGIIFYGIGHITKNKIKTSYNSKIPIAISIFICGMLQIVLYPFTGADLATLYLKNAYLYVPIALIGIFLYWQLSILIKKNRVIEFLGVNSLVIFAFQEPVYRAIIFIVSKLTHIEIESIRLSFLLCIVTSILTIITILPAIHIWNKKIMPIIKKI